MSVFKKIFILIILLLMSSAVLADDVISDRLIIDEVMTMFGLDPESYLIEVLSNHLNGRNIAHCGLTLMPLAQKDPVGLFSVMATLTQGNKVVATGQIRLRIRKYANVVVANDRINRGDVLAPHRLVIKKMETTHLVEQPLLTFDGLDRFRARRNLRKGTIVTEGALEPIPSIERGGETLIIYSNGLREVTARGLALQSGSTGEYIKVKNKSTNKIIVARIVDNSSVIVD